MFYINFYVFEGRVFECCVFFSMLFLLRRIDPSPLITLFVEDLRFKKGIVCLILILIRFAKIMRIGISQTIFYDNCLFGEIPFWFFNFCEKGWNYWCVNGYFEKLYWKYNVRDDVFSIMWAFVFLSYLGGFSFWWCLFSSPLINWWEIWLFAVLAYFFFFYHTKYFLHFDSWYFLNSGCFVCL